MKLIKKDNNIFLKFSDDIKDVKIKPITDDIFVIVLEKQSTKKFESKSDLVKEVHTMIKETNSNSKVKLESKKEDINEKLDEAKLTLLKKIYRIPFKMRELNILKGEFTREEISLLRELLSSGNIFLYKKDDKKFIALDNKIYEMFKKQHISFKNTAGLPNYTILDPNSARQLVEKAPKTYAAVRHFDGKVYLVKKPLYLEWSKPINQVIREGPITPEEISKRTNIDKIAVLVVLRILGDMGEVLEVEKGKFVSSDL